MLASTSAPRLFAALLLLVGCARHHAIIGQVVDRNGKPVDKAIVTVSPGEVQMVTDSEGNFVIDYLRDDEGNRTKLKKKSDYTLETFRVGYHASKVDVYFKKGELFIEPLTMTEDTIRVREGEADLDPVKYPDRAQSAGAAYEGE